jgi:hypothetical protein
MGYSIAHDGGIIAMEGYLAIVFGELNWFSDKADSVELCDIASDNGFVNLGDYGHGFVFYLPVDVEMNEKLESYFDGE